MTDTGKAKGLVSRILKTEDIKWQDLTFLQAETFKELSREEEEKLRWSIRNNQFTDPFKVWHDLSENVIYCLDGKHRTLVLTNMLSEGVDVPELLPATFIECSGKQEAARLVLQFSSQYARTTQNGLIEFLDTYDLGLADIQLGINIPDIDMEKLFGDLDRDFSTHNEELNIEEFTDEIVLKLTYPREQYIAVKQKLTELMGTHNVSTPEALIKNLIGLHE